MTSSNGAILFGSVINLAIGITAMVFMGILLQNNTTKDLNALERTTDMIEDNITTAADGVPDAVDCQQALLDKNETFINCTDVGFAECERLTDMYVASANNLTILTVQSLNETLNRVVDSCTDQISTLRARIAEVALLSGTPAVLLESGVSNVMVDGANALMSAGWELYRIDGLAASDLVFEFLVLLPWSGAVSTTSANPVITYESLPFLSDLTGTRFLLRPQQAKWAPAGNTVVAWGGNLKFYTEAPMGGSFQLLSRMSIQ